LPAIPIIGRQDTQQAGSRDIRIVEDLDGPTLDSFRIRPSDKQAALIGRSSDHSTARLYDGWPVGSIQAFCLYRDTAFFSRVVGQGRAGQGRRIIPD
jgi:hypothetical protein